MAAGASACSSSDEREPVRSGSFTASTPTVTPSATATPRPAEPTPASTPTVRFPYDPETVREALIEIGIDCASLAEQHGWGDYDVPYYSNAASSSVCRDERGDVSFDSPEIVMMSEMTGKDWATAHGRIRSTIYSDDWVVDFPDSDEGDAQELRFKKYVNGLAG
jgi:hypothetical protein